MKSEAQKKSPRIVEKMEHIPNTRFDEVSIFGIKNLYVIRL